jgi:hypothetical protein
MRIGVRWIATRKDTCFLTLSKALPVVLLVLVAMATAVGCLPRNEYRTHARVLLSTNHDFFTPIGAQRATRAFSSIDENDTDAIGPLMSLARSERWYYQSAIWLSRLGRRVEPSLLELAREENCYSKRAAMMALRHTGAKSPAALAAKLSRVTDADAEVRKEALAALETHQDSEDAVVPVLIMALNDADDGVRKTAASTLSAFPYKWSEITPALVRA